MNGREDGNGEENADHDIRALDTATIQRIAAGEVVERPASVVKELVENSLDADASRVSVAIAGDGTEEIRVRDDGVGMTESALRTAVEEHTTSKIRDIDDLEAGVGTLGFRGEALNTIGAVSRLTIRSKTRGGSRGTELVYEGGEIVDVRPAGCPEGTVIEVRDLFYNTPARRKFLKTEATEFDHVNTVVTQYALANPAVAVSLEHDDREVFATEGRGSRESAVLSVYGRTVAESMIAVDAETDHVGVEGLVSDPETTRSTREYLSTFVNGRYVTSGTLREAVLDAYGGQLAPDRYPFAVLFVDIDPESVDVNVHPRKMEVRFDEEGAVRRGVRDAVESALLEAGLIRSSAPRGRSKADETEIRPESPDDEAVAEPRRGGERTDGRRATPRRTESNATDWAETNTEGADGTDGSGTVDTGKTAETAETPKTPKTAEKPKTPKTADATDHETAVDDGTEGRGDGATASHVDTDDGHGTDNNQDADDSHDANPTENGPSEFDGSWGGGRDSSSTVEVSNDEDEKPAREGPVETSRARTPDGASTREPPVERERRSGENGIATPMTQRTLGGGAVERDRTFDRLPRLRVLGQLHETYIIAASDEGLVLVDQHAADERVNFERLRRELEGETPTQALAEPVELELTAREAALFDEYQEALAQVGFHAGRVSERVVEVRTVPAIFDTTLDPDALRDALSGFVTDEEGGGRETVDAAAESLIADLACYPSVTGNTSLTEGSVFELLDALDDCDNPYACPHGRPTVIRVDRDEIESRFERDYPGHAGRRRTE